MLLLALALPLAAQYSQSLRAVSGSLWGTLAVTRSSAKKIIVRLVRSNKVTVVNSGNDADALLVGTAGIGGPHTREQTWASGRCGIRLASSTALLPSFS
jgi:hypothetical protein